VSVLKKIMKELQRNITVNSEYSKYIAGTESIDSTLALGEIN